jgi:hypothetical protein
MNRCSETKNWAQMSARYAFLGRSHLFVGITLNPSF